MNEVMLESVGMVAAVIPAGGKGRRFGTGNPKQFLELDGWPVLAHTIARFEQTGAVDQIVVVVPEEHVSWVLRDLVDAFGFGKVVAVTPGGETRQESVYQGFLALGDEVDLVVVHDAVRPLVGASTIEEVVKAARAEGAAIAAVPIRDTLKRVKNGIIQGTLDRDSIWQAQTPQAFRRPILAQALAAARAADIIATDEASLVERLGHPIRIVHGAADNIKITMPEDLVLAETLLDYGRGRNMRIGTGIDVHTFMAERKLMLGCVEVPFERGLAGHSDADVLAHALCDAILGAAGLGDIGQHFPDDSPEWAGAAGKRLLGLTMEKVRSAGYELESADVTLLAERPKIKNFKGNMVQAMAEAMSVDRARLNVKATTTEGLGAIGREEGLAAMAVALLRQRPARSER